MFCVGHPMVVAFAVCLSVLVWEQSCSGVRPCYVVAPVFCHCVGTVVSLA